MQHLPIEFATPEYDEALALRFEVLRKPLGLTYEEEQIADEYAHTHLASFDEQGRVVACLMLTTSEAAIIRMRQVAVQPTLQGTGIGSALVTYSEAWAKRHGYTEMQLHARETAVRFYQRLGYEAAGNSFEEVGITHFKMLKQL